MSVNTTPVNNWNFLNWYTVNGVDTSTLAGLAMTKYGQFAEVETSLPFKQGDEFAFYINFDSAISTSGFSNWKLGLVDCQYSLLISDIGTLSQDLIGTTSSYYVYSEFTWPVVPGKGLYYLIIWDSSDNSVKYRSNALEKYPAWQANEQTQLVVYRNSTNIFNFQYESVTGFYNKFRVPIWLRDPQPSDDTIGYDLNDGRFLPVRTVVKKTYLFVTEGDEYYNDGFFAMTRHHDYLRINNIDYERGSGADYSVSPPENGYPLYDAEIRLYAKDQAASYEIQ